MVTGAPSFGALGFGGIAHGHAGLSDYKLRLAVYAVFCVTFGVDDCVRKSVASLLSNSFCGKPDSGQRWFDFRRAFEIPNADDGHICWHFQPRSGRRV